MRVMLMDNPFARSLFRSGSRIPGETKYIAGRPWPSCWKFGRDMGPDDPFFFDPEADTPRFRTPAQAGYAFGEVAELIEQAGIAPAHVYAFRKTGGLLPPGAASLTPQEIEEWEAAVVEYYTTVS